MDDCLKFHRYAHIDIHTIIGKVLCDIKQFHDHIPSFIKSSKMALLVNGDGGEISKT